MRRLLAIVASLFLLACAPTSAAKGTHAQEKPAVGPLETCGEKADDGILLYRVYDDAGRPADIPLALSDPTNTAHIAVAVSEPKFVSPIPYDCRAFVSAHDGSTYLIDGVTGDVLDLPLGELEDDSRSWDYKRGAGGQRWGVFAPEGRGFFEQAAIVDFETGQVTDLFALIPDMVAVTNAEFSPSGTYLAVYAEMEEPAFWNQQWLIPMEDPDQLRLVEDGAVVNNGFDEADSMMVYWGLDDDLRQRLVIEDLSDGSSRVVAEAPRNEGDEPFLSGWFIPGSDDLLVRYPDRVALIDLDDETPGERFAVDGAFSGFLPAPDGETGILIGHEAPNSVDVPELHYVDFDDETIQPIVSETGEALQIVWTRQSGDDHPRWIFLALGGLRDSLAGLAAFDLETGVLTPILSVENESLDQDLIQSTGDGRVALVPSTVMDAGERIWILDAEKGTANILAEAASIGIGLSPNGRWAAFSTLERADDRAVQSLTVVDTRRDRRIDFGAGLEPIWLIP